MNRRARVATGLVASRRLVHASSCRPATRPHTTTATNVPVLGSHTRTPLSLLLLARRAALGLQPTHLTRCVCCFNNCRHSPDIGFQTCTPHPMPAQCATWVASLQLRVNTALDCIFLGCCFEVMFGHTLPPWVFPNEWTNVTEHSPSGRHQFLNEREVFPAL